MKKIKVCVVLCIVLLALVLGINQLLAAPCGDTNSDGNINITDALLIAQASVGGNPANFDQGAADVNGDGNRNITDALLVVQYYVGIIDSLPCQGTEPTPTSNNSSANEVTLSGSTWTARANGSVVYTGSRMFDAVNAACNGAGNNATISIRNSGDSGNDGGDVYAIRPLAGQTLNFNGCTVNCNSNGDLVVPIHADKRNNITIQNLRVTGNPRYGVWFRGCSNVTLTNITMNLSNDSPVGLGIRVDGSTGSASNLTINGTIEITGSAGHGIETYSVNGVNIGDVIVNDTGGCGVLLNDSTNCRVGVVRGNRNCPNAGYATFRVANSNGSTYCEGVYSRNSGRGFFSVSDSHDCTIGWVDIANTYSQCIFLEDATNTVIESGTVSNGNPNVQHVRCSNCRTSVNGTTYTANDGKW